MAYAKGASRESNSLTGDAAKPCLRLTSVSSTNMTDPGRLTNASSASQATPTISSSRIARLSSSASAPPSPTASSGLTLASGRRRQETASPAPKAPTLFQTPPTRTSPARKSPTQLQTASGEASTILSEASLSASDAMKAMLLTARPSSAPPQSLLDAFTRREPSALPVTHLRATPSTAMVLASKPLPPPVITRIFSPAIFWLL